MYTSQKRKVKSSISYTKIIYVLYKKNPSQGGWEILGNICYSQDFDSFYSLQLGKWKIYFLPTNLMPKIDTIMPFFNKF